MRRTTILVALLLSACGGGSGLGSTVAELSVTVDEGNGKSDTAALTCSTSTTGDGTRWLSDEGVANRACEVVSGNASRLIDGPGENMMCTQQYGGPQTAQVTGTYEGSAVDTEFHRRDGCGIADWSTFEVLFGRIPGGPTPVEG